jgi:hypothetical protein
VSTPRPPLDLRRPRDLGAVVSDGFAIYRQNFWVLLALAAAVVVPVELIVSGLGLGWLTSGYDSSPGVGEVIVPLLSQNFVTSPLITAMALFVLLDAADGERARFGATLQRSLDLFAPVFLVVVILAIGVVTGLMLLIIPGIYLAVRWLFAPAAVIIDGKRGIDAFQRSSDLVRNYWWRCLGVLLVVYILTNIPANLIQQGAVSAAKSADSAAIELAGQIVASTLALPLLALMIGLLYFDQTLRQQHKS